MFVQCLPFRTITSFGALYLAVGVNCNVEACPCTWIATHLVFLSTWAMNSTFSNICSPINFNVFLGTFRCVARNDRAQAFRNLNKVRFCHWWSKILSLNSFLNETTCGYTFICISKITELYKNKILHLYHRLGSLEICISKLTKPSVGEFRKFQTPLPFYTIFIMYVLTRGRKMSTWENTRIIRSWRFFKPNKPSVAI